MEDAELKTVYYGSDKVWIAPPKRGAPSHTVADPLIEKSDSEVEFKGEEQFFTPIKPPKPLKPYEAVREKGRLLEAARKKRPTPRVKKGDRYLYGTITDDSEVDHLSEGLELTLALTDDLIQTEKWMEEYAHLSRNLQVVLRDALTEQVERASDSRNILAQIKGFRDREMEKSWLRKKIREYGTQVTPGLKSGVYSGSGSGREVSQPNKANAPEIGEITPISIPLRKVPTPPVAPKGAEVTPMEHEPISSKRKQRSSPSEEPISRRRKEVEPKKVLRVTLPKIDALLKGKDKGTPQDTPQDAVSEGEKTGCVEPLCEVSTKTTAEEYPVQGEKW